MRDFLDAVGGVEKFAFGEEDDFVFNVIACALADDGLDDFVEVDCGDVQEGGVKAGTALFGDILIQEFAKSKHELMTAVGQTFRGRGS